MDTLSDLLHKNQVTITIGRVRALAVTFFVLFGVCVAVFSTFKGFIFNTDSEVIKAQQTAIQAMQQAHASDSTTKSVILQEIRMRDSLLAIRVIEANEKAFHDLIQDSAFTKSQEINKSLRKLLDKISKRSK